MSFSQDIKEEIMLGLSKKFSKAMSFGERLTQSHSKNELEEDFSEFFDISKLDEKSIKNILKGSYLSTGCIVDPNKDYHFELIFHSKTCSDYILNLLSLLEFTPKCIKRNSGKTSSYVVYIKDSEQISTFLSVIEAANSMLQFEEIRVEKNVKNNINRSINCETANIAKTVSSAVKQINAIEKLKLFDKFDSLDASLKNVANLRMENIEASLDGLSKLSFKSSNMHNRLTKSGFKRRLDKIIELADELKGKYDEHK